MEKFLEYRLVVSLVLEKGFFNFVLIGIHFMQGWTATTRHGVTRKKTTKRLRHRATSYEKNSSPQKEYL